MTHFASVIALSFLFVSQVGAQTLYVDDGRNSVTVQAQQAPQAQGQVYVQSPQGQVYVQGQPGQVYAQQQQGQVYVQQQPQYAQPQYVQQQRQYVQQPAPVEEPRSRHVIGLDVGAIIPVGDWAELTYVAFGGQFRYEFNAIAGLFVTGRAGYFFHLNDAELTTGHIPIMAGVKYRFLDGMTPFVSGELGIAIWHASGNASTGFGSVGGSDSEAKFAVTLGGGYDFGPVELRLNLDVPAIDRAVAISSTVGFDFAEF